MTSKSTKPSLYINEKIISGFEIQDWSLKTLAKDIYENIGQVLSLVKLQIASLNPDKKEEVKQLAESSDQLLDKAISDLRKLARILSPAEILQKGFAASLLQELGKLNKLGFCTVKLQFDGEAFRLEEVRELILFSIVQHYIMKALYVEGVKDISVRIRYKVRAIAIRISYIEMEKSRLNIPTTKRSGIYRRAKMINAAIQVRRNAPEKIINIVLKK